MALQLEDWSGSTIGTVPIGQGIAVTPMQMVAAYAAIGNHGVMRTAVHRRARRLRSRSAARRPGVSSRRRPPTRVMAMLRSVVVEGTGGEAAIPGYTVAGKTGTAAKPENGRYVAKYVASFVGLVPAAQAALRDPRRRRRAARRDLGRRRRGAGVRRHRPVRAPVPRGAARRARDEGRTRRRVAGAASTTD